jgi:uncharacterized membrane protein YccC
VKVDFKAADLLFSAKSYLAAMLAFFVALKSGLANPSWAVITAYVVAQPKVGTVVSKSCYRLIGTMVGAAMSVLLVPPLSNAPELLSVAIAAWLGLCVFCSSIDKTSRAYMFVLAGFSSCVIVFPNIGHPEEIFNIASLRVEEIGLGIACSALIHAIVFPVTLTTGLPQRFEDLLQKALCIGVDTLSDVDPGALEQNQKQLLIAANDVRDLLIEVEFERELRTQRLQLAKSLLAQVERIGPLSAAVHDRISELRRANALTPAVGELLGDARCWLSEVSAGKSPAADAGRLRSRCNELQDGTRPKFDWDDALSLSLLSRLADLIDVYCSCLTLRRTLSAQPFEEDATSKIHAQLDKEPRAFERDYQGALLSALSTTAVVILASGLWIASGWTGGAGAVLMTSILFSLYSNLANPTLALKNKLIGVCARLVLGAFYVLAVLPSVDSFLGIAIALAPALLASGLLLTRAPHSALAFNLIIGLLGPSIIAEQFSPDFSGYLNSGLATLVGIQFTLVMMRFTQALWLDRQPVRILRAARIDISRGGNLPSVNWRTKMGHRIALLSKQSGKAHVMHTTQLWRDLKAGLSLAELAGLACQLPGEARTHITAIQSAATAHYRLLAEDRVPPDDLLREIDHAILTGNFSHHDSARRAFSLSLVGLRRCAFPAAAPLKENPILAIAP